MIVSVFLSFFFLLTKISVSHDQFLRTRQQAKVQEIYACGYTQAQLALAFPLPLPIPAPRIRKRLPVGDRLSALVLLGSLVLMDQDRRHGQLFTGMLALDISECSSCSILIRGAGGGLGGGQVCKDAFLTFVVFYGEVSEPSPGFWIFFFFLVASCMMDGCQVGLLHVLARTRR